jgi:hypothetical protein
MLGTQAGLQEFVFIAAQRPSVGFGIPLHNALALKRPVVETALPRARWDADR